MLTLLVDTNVLLDVALRRQPWHQDATALLAALATGRARGFVAGHAVTTLHYVVARANGRAAALSAVSDTLTIVAVAPVEGAEFQRALTMGLRDFEDAVQAAAALRVGADYLVTRDSKDYRDAPVQARSPAEALALL